MKKILTESIETSRLREKLDAVFSESNGFVIEKGILEVVDVEDTPENQVTLDALLAAHDFDAETLLARIDQEIRLERDNRIDEAQNALDQFARQTRQKGRGRIPDTKITQVQRDAIDDYVQDLCELPELITQENIDSPPWPDIPDFI